MTQSRLTVETTDGDLHAFVFADTSTDILSVELERFFTLYGYKLIDGSPEEGIFGRGGGLLHRMFGLGSAPIRFHVAISDRQDRHVLHIGAKSGTLLGGGFLTATAVSKEMKWLYAALRVCFTPPDEGADS